MKYHYTPVMHDNGTFANIVEVYSKKYPGKFKNEEEEDSFESKYHRGSIEIQKKNKPLDEYLDTIITALPLLVKQFVSKNDKDFYMRLNANIVDGDGVELKVTQFCSSDIPYGTLLITKRLY